MDGGKIRVFEQRYKICLGGFLQRHDSRRLEPQIGLQSSMATMRQCSQTERGRETHFEVLCNLTHKPLEGKFANEEFCRLLVPSDFTQSDGTGAEPMWLLHTTRCCLQTSHKSVICHGKGREQEPTSRHSRQSYGPLMTWQRVVCGGLCLNATSSSVWSLRAELAEPATLPPVDLRAVCLVRAMR
jgi:hypothetical protein